MAGGFQGVTNKMKWRAAVHNGSTKAAKILAEQMHSDSLEYVPKEENTLRDSFRMEETAEERARAIRENYVGKRSDVLFETETDGVADGLTGGYMRVYTDARVKLGEIAPMQLARLYKDGFWAEME